MSKIEVLDARVRFHTDSGRFDVSIDHGVLRIVAGINAIAVLPVASNVILVKERGWDTSGYDGKVERVEIVPLPLAA